MSKETVGSVSSKLIQKELETKDPIEQMREQLDDYDKNIDECVKRSLIDFLGSFYVIVITKKERLMPNVIRNYFMGRSTCPTPDYDQVVYRYDRSSSDLSFLWVIPSKDTCELLAKNKHIVAPEEYALLDFVIKFYDDTLLKQAKILNGEQHDSMMLDPQAAKLARQKS